MMKLVYRLKNWISKMSLGDKILAVVCLLGVIVSGIVIMTYGRTLVNSDMAIASLFADSFYRNHNLFSSSWCYANGDVWTLYPAVGILSIIFYPFFGAGAFVRSFVVLIQLLLGVVTLIIFSKSVYRDESWTLMIPLGSLYLFGIATYILYDGCYGDFIIWQPLVCMLFIMVYEKYIDGKYISLPVVCYTILIYILSVRGPRTLADFALPMVITVLVMEYRRVAERKHVSIATDVKDVCYFLVVNVLPAVLGLVTYKWLATWHNINNVKESLLVFNGNTRDIWNGLINSVLYYFDVFGFQAGVSVTSIIGLRNFVSIIMSAIVCIIVPILQGIKISKETKIVQFLYFYTIIHNTIMLLCSVFFNFVLKYHMTSSVVLFVLISAHYICKYWIKQENKVRGYMWVILFVIATCIECVAMLTNIDGWKERLESKENISNILEEHGLSKGYATFWNAYANQLYSNNIIRFGAVSVEQSRLQEYWWLVDTTIFQPESGQSFVMLTDEELAGEYDFGTILYGYEQPIEEFTIENALCYSDALGEYTTNLHVFVYADDYATHLVNGSNDGVVEPKEMFFNGIGMKDNSQVILWKDGLIFGPYSNLDKGKYTVKFNGSGLSNCHAEILAENYPDAYEYEIISTDDTAITVELIVASRVEGIQYRITNDSENPAAVINITIQRIK